MRVTIQEAGAQVKHEKRRGIGDSKIEIRNAKIEGSDGGAGGPPAFLPLIRAKDDALVQRSCESAFKI